MISTSAFAESRGPIDCYNATPTGMSAENAVRLCRRAVSRAPIDCYNATPSTISPKNAVELCRGIR